MLLCYFLLYSSSFSYFFYNFIYALPLLHPQLVNMLTYFLLLFFSHYTVLYSITASTFYYCSSPHHRTVEIYFLLFTLFPSIHFYFYTFLPALSPASSSLFIFLHFSVSPCVSLPSFSFLSLSLLPIYLSYNLFSIRCVLSFSPSFLIFSLIFFLLVFLDFVSQFYRNFPITGNKPYI